MDAYRSEEQNTTYYVSCVCERNEWIFLPKTKIGGLPSDMKLLKHMWKRVSSLNQEAFRDYYSNYLTFKNIRVLSPSEKPVDFSASIERLRKREIHSLYYYFMTQLIRL
jgi:hypothetical protein